MALRWWIGCWARAHLCFDAAATRFREILGYLEGKRQSIPPRSDGEETPL
jgi:hypothetical protein